MESELHPGAFPRLALYSQVAADALGPFLHDGQSDVLARAAANLAGSAHREVHLAEGPLGQVALLDHLEEPAARVLEALQGPHVHQRRPAHAEASALPELPLQYSDFSIWQRKSRASRETSGHMRRRW